MVKLIIVGALTLGLLQRFATYRGIPAAVTVLGLTVFIVHFMMMNTVLGDISMRSAVMPVRQEFNCKGREK